LTSEPVVKAQPVQIVQKGLEIFKQMCRKNNAPGREWRGYNLLFYKHLCFPSYLLRGKKGRKIVLLFLAKD
jgi:hypothetical protein